MPNDSPNLEGEYVPDIPLPQFHLFSILKRCPACNQAYFSEPGYRGHYALVHICKLGERK